MNKHVFVENPLLAVSFSGLMDEGFLSGMIVILVDRVSRFWYSRIVEKVHDHLNGRCTIELALVS